MKHFHDGPNAGRTVLVTGATSGIGHATALRLATLGAHIAITGRDRDRTQQAAGEITAAAAGRRVEVLVADLSSQAQLRRLAGEVLEALPRIDVLVNRSGAATSIHLASAPDLEQVSGRSSARSYEQAVAARLWEASADLVGLTAAPRV